MLLLGGLCLPAIAASVQELRDGGRALFDRAATLHQIAAPLPRELVPLASAAVSASDNLSLEERTRLGLRLNQLLAATVNLEQDPGLAGQLAWTVNETFTVGGEATTDLVYTPARDLLPGAEIIVDFHRAAPGIPQNVDQAARNYIAIAADGADFEAVADVEEAMRGSLDGDEVRASFRLVAGSVPAGAPVSISFSRLELPTRAYGRFPIAFRVRFEQDQYAYPIPPLYLALTPQDASLIVVSAPLEVASDEQVPVTVRVQDRFGNLAAGRIPPFDVLVDGDFRASIEGGDDPTPVAELGPLALGTHTVEVRSAGGGLRAETTVRSSALPSRVIWLEPHAETDRSGSLATEPEVRRRFLGLVDRLQIIEQDRYLDLATWDDRQRQGVDGFVRAANIRAGGQGLIFTNGPMTDAEAPRLRFPAGATLSALPADAMVAALPEVPFDPRLVARADVQLVEILSGASSHEWFGQQLLQQGKRLGFLGSATAHDRGAEYPFIQGRTAVRLRPGESVFAALAEGRTWVTTGARIFLDVATNGAAPGARAAGSVNRVIRGEVRGTAPIDRIELIRNGEVIAVRDLGHDPDSDRLSVSVHSDSTPRGRLDLPRNGREWIGYVRILGGSVAALDADSLGLQPGQAAAINPRDPSRVDFITWTRGLGSSFQLNMALEDSEQTPRQGIEVVLRRGVEDASQTPLYRTAAEIPPTTMAISIGEMDDGPVTREYDVEGYKDAVTLKRVREDAPSRTQFEFLDRRIAGEGDYYYVRVVQMDDHVAISSPTFVGGFDPH